ncbi:PILR alpha-associated neural protein-like, partial [Scleropages formosus]
SISPVTRLAALCCLLVASATRHASCDGGARKEGRREGEREPTEEMQIGTFPPQLSVTTQATPTPLWAVVWGPTHPIEDETPHFPSAYEMSSRHPLTEGWEHRQGPPTTQTQQLLQAEREEDGWVEGGTETDREVEEVDPQFYVTVTISSLLILTAVIITAKLCYDRSCSRHPPPLSRGTAPPLSLSIPRSLTPEEGRRTLHGLPSFTDRERIPVVNL